MDTDDAIKMRPYPRYPNGFVLFVSLLAFAIVFLFGSLQKQSVVCETNTTNQRVIINSTIPIVHLWSRDITIANRTSNTLLIGTQDQIIASRYCPNAMIDKVAAFDWRSGQLLWNADIKPNVYDVAVDTDRDVVYLEATGRVQSLGIKDGVIRWTNESDLFNRTPHPLQVLPDGQLITYLPDTIKRVNTSDGSLEAIKYPKGTFLLDGDTAYVWTPTGQERFWDIQAIDLKTQQSKWTADTYLDVGIPSEISFRPYVDEGLLIYRNSGIQTSLIVVDKETGNLLWKIDNYADQAIVSNTVVLNGVLYALDHRARLYLFNARTAHQLGIVEFARPNRNENDLLYQPNAIGGSYIAVSGKYVAVYFQDTHVLSVFAIEPPVIN